MTNPAATIAAQGVTIRHTFAAMELRDWFAGQALAAMPLGVTDSTSFAIANDAYALADAMLAHRECGK